MPPLVADDDGQQQKTARYSSAQKYSEAYGLHPKHFPSVSEMQAKRDEKQRAVFNEWEQAVSKKLEGGVDAVTGAVEVDIPLAITYKYLDRLRQLLVAEGYHVEAWDEFGTQIVFDGANRKEGDQRPFDDIWDEASRAWDSVVVKAKQLFTAPSPWGSAERRQEIPTDRVPRAGKLRISLPLSPLLTGKKHPKKAPLGHCGTSAVSVFFASLSWTVIDFLNTAPIWKVFFGPLIVSVFICPIWMHRVVLLVVSVALAYRFARWMAAGRGEEAQQPPPPPTREQERGVHGLHHRGSNQVTIKQNGDYLEIYGNGPDDIDAMRAAIIIFETSARALRRRVQDSAANPLQGRPVDLDIRPEDIPSAPPAQQQRDEVIGGWHKCTGPPCSSVQK